MFGPGDDGGVKVIKAADADRSFYVTDDEKAIIIQVASYLVYLAA